MRSSVKLQSSQLSTQLFCSCDNVYHTQQIRVLLYLLGRIVT